MSQEFVCYLLTNIQSVCSVPNDWKYKISKYSKINPICIQTRDMRIIEFA